MFHNKSQTSSQNSSRERINNSLLISLFNEKEEKRLRVTAERLIYVALLTSILLGSEFMGQGGGGVKLWSKYLQKAWRAGMNFQNGNELPGEADLYADFPLAGFTDEHWTGRQNQSDSQRKLYIKKYHLLNKEKGESDREEWGEKHSAIPVSISKISFYFFIVPYTDTDKGSKNHHSKDFKKQSTSFSLPVNRNMDRILRRKNAVINKLQGSTCIQSTFTLRPWGCKDLSYNIKDEKICP